MVEISVTDGRVCALVGVAMMCVSVKATGAGKSANIGGHWLDFALEKWQLYANKKHKFLLFCHLRVHEALKRQRCALDEQFWLEIGLDIT